jgi:hypothetical protein
MHIHLPSVIGLGTRCGARGETSQNLNLVTCPVCRKALDFVCTLQIVAAIGLGIVAALEGPEAIKGPPFRFCVQCGELRTPAPRGGRVSRPVTPQRCGECSGFASRIHEVRFDGHTGERLNPPPMPLRSCLGSYLGGEHSSPPAGRIGHTSDK